MTTPEDPHLSAAAYVLHALPPAEEAAYEHHLAGCEVCRQDVTVFERTAARLASAETAPVPEQLRVRVMEQVSRTPQDRRHHTTRPHGGSLRRNGLRLALAASVAVAAALGAVAVREHQEADEARAQAAQAQEQARIAGGAFADVLTAPDATVHTGALADGAEAAVVVSRAQAKAAFTARDLPALPSGTVYELWYAGEAGDLRPAGLLDDTGDRATRVLDGPLGNAVAVGITVEPAGGSDQPTTEPLGIISISTKA
ncbi:MULTISPECIES: anti-sigma factor domain-containing protein [unclassified Streptomyces]|uniref:anti-sigma factor n=1 Tax=unclassified Streptomyces TaxID=2593676 RepID=UPI001E2F443D|nr:anti-sigma factor [Streptomyces sp. CB02980]MCB8906905.1 anti-sigma factor [Streptomyces sp. CB02980]